MFEEVTRAAEEHFSKSAPSNQTEDAASSEPKTAEQGQPGDISELSLPEKFKFEGRDWTPQEFKKAYLMQSDYTKKTTQLAEERKALEETKEFQKYYDNLESDLEAVKSNPELAARFKELYPEKFHKFLGYVAPTNTAPAPNERPASNLSPEIEAKLSKIDHLENYIKEQEVSAMEVKLQALSEKFKAKYPDADELSVLAAADTLHKRGTKMTEDKWEEIWKQHNDRDVERFNARQKRIQETQLKAHNSAKDMASGGGVPGQGPKTMTIKEAREAAIKHFS